MTDLDDALQKIKTALSKHWESCAANGLAHNSRSRDQVIGVLSTYVESVQRMAKPHGDGPVLTAIRQAYEALDVINAADDDGLLETDERELLVPFIVEVAVWAGVSPEAHDGEPGGEFRNF